MIERQGIALENEVKEVVYIAVSAIILSFVLGFASYVMTVRGDIAEIRNEQIVANNNVLQYSKYNKYSRNTLIGDEVIECIRLYYDSGIDIFVDDRTNIDSGIRINSSTGCAGAGDDHRLFNMDQYTRHAGTENDYFSVSPESATTPRNDLRNWFPTHTKYRAYLVYNGENVETYYNNMIDKFDAKRTTETGSAANLLLDSVEPEKLPNSEVSGIVFINVATYGGE